MTAGIVMSVCVNVMCAGVCCLEYTSSRRCVLHFLHFGGDIPKNLQMPDPKKGEDDRNVGLSESHSKVIISKTVNCSVLCQRELKNQRDGSFPKV